MVVLVDMVMRSTVRRTEETIHKAFIQRLSLGAYSN